MWNKRHKTEEIFYTLKEAQIIIEQWRCHYNTKRPHRGMSRSMLKS